MQSQIVKNAETYVINLLKLGLKPEHRYHDLNHTLSMRDASQELGRRYRLSEEELELLELAGLFHDTGFTKTYVGHEDVSREIATDFLQKEQFDPAKIEQVNRLIEVTKVGVEPELLLEKIIKDADFNTNGATYEEKSEALRKEWEVFCNQKMTDDEWTENGLKFWESHRFYTGEAQALYGDSKRKTVKTLRKSAEKIKPSDDMLDFAIGKSKSAQMMFKTTLRNQIDLTNIADNKANIMLSINSLLITIGIPMLAGNLKEHPSLIYPASVLLLTCILSIVFATLATRPVKMHGKTSTDTIDSGNSNLFFFGNFFKMERDDYMKGLMRVMQNEEIIDKSIVNDLFFLGRTLGFKYRRLRITYEIFMVGMVLTVITFGILYLTGNY
ncbi:MAG: HD domain-containing protein [Saprospiraceae bacterium]|nr:HD domain-containing protein [Saprospiraceae bacterium]